MDLLQREMERKKKALQEAKKKVGGGYVKAGDLRRHQEEQEEELALQRREQEKTAEKRSLEEKEENFRKKSSKKKRKKEKAAAESLPSETTNNNSKKEGTRQQSSLAEMQKQLRALGLPVTLFGETLQDRIERLQDAEKAVQENQLNRSEADEFRLGQGHGIRNPFLEKDATDEAAKAAQAEAVAALKPTVKSSSSLRDKDKKKEHEDEDDDDTNDPHKRVYKHFKGLLKQWEADLNERSDEVKRSVAGRNETKTLKQCKDYIRPLFQLCKRRQLEDNMITKLVEMVQHCSAGEFVKANDAYMDLAIGRSAWPIGVTQVGIHSRKGREKIGAANVAHVMNSELQRKYLTSVKRLITYEQKKRTDVDPSKKVINY